MIFEDELLKTKAKSDKLGIKSGLTQDEFNQAVLNQLENMSVSLSEARRATFSTAADLTTTAGKSLVKSVLFEPSAGDIMIQPNDASIDLTYDLNPTILSIPKDSIVRRVTVTVVGKKQVITNGDKTSQVISISPNEFPVTMDIAIKGDSPDGSFILSSTQIFDGTQKVGLINFNKSVTEAAPITTQEDLNVKLLQEIEYLKRQTNK